jgi:hypothetical protein
MVAGVVDGAVPAAFMAGAATAAGALVGKVPPALRRTSGRKGEEPVSYYTKSFEVVELGTEKQEPQSVVVEAKEEPQSLPVEQQSLLEVKEEPQAQLEVKEEELWAQLEVGLQGPPPSPNRQILSGWQQVLPPPPPLPTGNYVLDKCNMPLALSLRMKKSMHDIAEIDPEALFNNVSLYYEPGVWRLNIKPHIMWPGIEVEEDPTAYRIMGMHATNPQGIRGILQLGVHEGERTAPPELVCVQRVLGQARATRPQASSCIVGLLQTSIIIAT